ncbi:MAG: twin-arginine translocase TatA/TatE family subunit [Elusimicrobia bacterium]|nr:twin-arginine translocase TatA/TatE family subunit [Elusimicrobiota bacterium]
MDLGPDKLIIIAVIALVLFGPGKIPEFARQLGRSVNMFKKGLKEGMDDEAPGAPEPDARGGTPQS